MGQMNPILRTQPCIQRNPNNPILSKKDVPYQADLVFNAGVTKWHGGYIMLFRDDYDYRGETKFGGCCLGIADSRDGVNWKVREEPFLTAADLHDPEITRIYDPRLTVMGERCYLCFAVDTRHGVRGGIGVTDDFKTMEILSMSAPDNRNMALFPEKINGLFTRLERPFPVYSRGGINRFDIWIAQSPDLKFWGNERLLLGVEDVPFANDKIGPAAPPIKTSKGWLTLFHAVDLDPSRGRNGWESVWQKRYCAGIMLLDLQDPSKVIGMCREPLIAPEKPYECDDGFRTNVIFPGGMVLENDSEVKIYYGASDTVECLAAAHLDELLALCRPV
jgi:beta-1,4-mannooligosaccharide/beta-1,4-mannosyl-N-acetylglucosamine phosphorylase